MILKNKHLALTLIFSLIGCDLFLTENIKSKSSALLDQVINSMSLDTSSDKDIKHNSNNKSSQKHLPKIKRKIKKIKSLQQPELQKDIKDSLSEHENITIRTADTSQKKSYSNSNIIDNSSNTISSTNKDITTTSTLNKPTIQFNKENQPYHQNSETIEHKSNIFQGNSKTSLNGLNGESNNIQYDYTYLSHYDSQPTTISGSYSGSSMTIEEDEFEEDDDEERLETRLDNIYKFKLKKIIDSVQQALEIAEQIKEDLNKIEFNRLKLSNNGRKASEHEKQKAKEELSTFTKDKLETNLKELLSEIEKSLNDATSLITFVDKEYGGNLQSDLYAKKKLDELKSEVSSLITEVQKNQNNNHQAYPSLYQDFKTYQTLRNPYSTLQSVKDLLNKTNIVAR
ncbi:hypothetical protein [Borrelia persica]|uniref:hypothetical protein n=1 Tax=Borrelia persica TaxID=44448 RepID=UPI0004641F5E|nr:hypothetical protein [Borrelia persica]